MSAVLRLRIAIGLVLVLVLVALVSIVWTPYPVDSLSIGQAMQGTSGGHPLGTDQLGRDVLSMLMRGLLASFVVATVGTAIAIGLGVPVGYLARQWDAVPRDLLRRSGNALYTLPTLLIAALLAGAFGPGAPVPMLAIGLFAAPAFARATYDAMGTIGGLGYVEVARLAGLSPVEVLRRHIGPALGRALLAPVLEQIAIGILAEAAIAFVGLGTQSPGASLGLMLRDGQAYLGTQPSLVIVPGLLIVVAVLALNAVAAGLRGRFDPKPRATGAVYGA